MQQVEEDFLTLKFARVGLSPVLKKFIFDAYPGVAEDDFKQRIEIANAIAKKAGTLIPNDVDLKNKDTYKIYDPNSIGAYILHKAKYGILSKNLNSI